MADTDLPENKGWKGPYRGDFLSLAPLRPLVTRMAINVEPAEAYTVTRRPTGVAQQTLSHGRFANFSGVVRTGRAVPARRPMPAPAAPEAGSIPIPENPWANADDEAAPDPPAPVPSTLPSRTATPRPASRGTRPSAPRGARPPRPATPADRRLTPRPSAPVSSPPPDLATPAAITITPDGQVLTNRLRMRGPKAPTAPSPETAAAPPKPPQASAEPRPPKPEDSQVPQRRGLSTRHRGQPPLVADAGSSAQPPVPNIATTAPPTGQPATSSPTASPATAPAVAQRRPTGSTPASPEAPVVASSTASVPVVTPDGPSSSTPTATLPPAPAAPSSSPRTSDPNTPTPTPALGQPRPTPTASTTPEAPIVTAETTTTRSPAPAAPVSSPRTPAPQAPSTTPALVQRRPTASAPTSPGVPVITPEPSTRTTPTSTTEPPASKESPLRESAPTLDQRPIGAPATPESASRGAALIPDAGSSVAQPPMTPSARTDVAAGAPPAGTSTQPSSSTAAHDSSPLVGAITQRRATGTAGTPTGGDSRAEVTEEAVRVPRDVQEAVQAVTGQRPEHVTVRRGPGVNRTAARIAADSYATEGVVHLPGTAPLSTDRSRRLLAHELTHVVQQTSGSAPMHEVSSAGRDAEQQAMRAESALAAGQTGSSARAGSAGAPSAISGSAPRATVARSTSPLSPERAASLPRARAQAPVARPRAGTASGPPSPASHTDETGTHQPHADSAPRARSQVASASVPVVTSTSAPSSGAQTPSSEPTVQRRSSAPPPPPPPASPAPPAPSSTSGGRSGGSRDKGAPSGSTASPPPVDTASDDVWLQRHAQALYPHIRYLLRNEFLLDRERRGRLMRDD